MNDKGGMPILVEVGCRKDLKFYKKAKRKTDYRPLDGKGVCEGGGKVEE